MAKAKDFDGEANETVVYDKKNGHGIKFYAAEGRVWLLTQNNPQKYDVDLSKDGLLKTILPLMQKRKISYIAVINEQSLVVDEAGNHTPHAHILLYFPNSARGSQISKLFPHAAIFNCDANVPSVRKYLLKDTSGAWYQKHPEKLGEKLPTEEAGFWEFGDLPDGKRKDKKEEKAQKEQKENENRLIVQGILVGMSDADLIQHFPSCWRRSTELRKARYQILSAKYRSVYREMTCIYIEANFPPKKLSTLYPMSTDTYVVSDYTHPWDSYCAEPTIVLSNYVGQFAWLDLLAYLGGTYCSLHARFSDGVACYTTVIIVSPLSLYDLCKCQQTKEYNAEVLGSYLTHLRIYPSITDYPIDYVRFGDSEKWFRRYALPPHTEPPVICL